MLRGIATFIIEFFSMKQDTHMVNIPLLLFVVAVLLLALSVSITISRKHSLYIQPKKEKQIIHSIGENEVA